jgi:hypothetical protein
MEREMCSYLEWQLNVDWSTLCDFQSCVQQDFAGPGPYPAMALPQPALALFAHQCESRQLQHWFFHTGFRSPRVPTERQTCTSIPTYPSSPPDTPEASHLVSTSPASSVSPPTPPAPNTHKPLRRVVPRPRSPPVRRDVRASESPLGSQVGSALSHVLMGLARREKDSSPGPRGNWKGHDGGCNRGSGSKARPARSQVSALIKRSVRRLI